jgi:hypothetical protein
VGQEGALQEPGVQQTMRVYEQHDLIQALTC